MTHDDTAGVLVLPPFVVIGATLIGAGVQWIVPLPLIGTTWGPPVGIALLIGGFLLADRARREFKKHETSVKPYEPTTAMVTSGPYRFSRNPIYVGFLLAHLGVAFGFDAAWIAVMVVPAVPFFEWAVITREERYLERLFGDAYRAYRARVRRWV